MDEKYMARDQDFLIDKKCGILHPSGDACEQCLLNGKINSAFVAWEFREISSELMSLVMIFTHTDAQRNVYKMMTMFPFSSL